MTLSEAIRKSWIKTREVDIGGFKAVLRSPPLSEVCEADARILEGEPDAVEAYRLMSMELEIKRERAKAEAEAKAGEPTEEDVAAVESGQLASPPTVPDDLPDPEELREQVAELRDRAFRLRLFGLQASSLVSADVRKEESDLPWEGLTWLPASSCPTRSGATSASSCWPGRGCACPERPFRTES